MDTQSLEVKVDDEFYKINVGLSDTIQTITNELAKKLTISPLFIFLTKKDSVLKIEKIKGLPFNQVERISDATDLTSAKLEFTTLRQIEKMNKFSQAYTLSKKYLSDPEAVFATFYYFYKQPSNAEFIRDSTSQKFRDNFSESFDLLQQIDRNKFQGVIGVSSFINMYDKFYKRVEESIKTTEKLSSLKEILQQSSKYIQISKKLEKQMTDTKLTFTNIECVLSGMKEEKDEYEYFNESVLSTDVPLVYINGFYKILKGFKVNPAWIQKIKEYSDNEKNKNHLILYVLNKYNYNSNDKKDQYSLISANFQVDEGGQINSELHIQINSQIEDYNTTTDLKEEQLLTRVCNALNIQTKSISVKIYPQNLRCYFYITKTNMEKIFYYDLLMNNKIVSEFLCANERFRIFNKRGGIQCIFKQCETVFNMQSFFVTRPLRKRIGPLVNVNENVVEIKVSFAKNLNEVNLLKKYLALTVSIYNDQRKCLEQLYKQVPKFEEESVDSLAQGKKEKPVRVTLASYDPELFVEGYPKRCNKSPVIIEDEEEAKEKIKNGVDIMKYPLFDEFKVHYYSCEHRPEHSHPGLMKTDLTQWPLPCCFEVNQLEKKNAIRYMYENKVKFDDDEVFKDIKYKILQTSHTLPIGGIGRLAKDITNYFKIIDQENIYIRRYVPISPRSAIIAIASALLMEQVQTTDKDELDEFVDEQVQELKRLVKKNIGFQNAYEYDAKTLIQYLNQPEKFIDVRIFHTLLEELFKCNIFMFVHNKEYPQGNFGCPEFAQNFLLFEKKYNYRYSVILYETTGSNIENLLYPHYEIIGRLNMESSETDFLFNKDSITSHELINLYKTMYIPLGKETKNILKTSPFETRILKQQVDFFGKTRILFFENGVNIITMPTDSIPNSMFKKHEKDKKFDYTPCELQQAIQFMQDENVKYKQVILRNYLVGLSGTKDNTDFYIPVKPQSTNVLNTNIQQLHSISFIRDSELDKYNQYEQVSRHLLAHVIYEFSKFITGKKITNETLFTLLEEFYENVFTISNSPDLYSVIPRNFKKPTSFKKDGKILLNSQELAKRLLYSLFIECRKGFNQIQEYKELLFVPNYYKNIRDFASSEDNIIFHNSQELERWINSSKPPQYKIHKILSEEFVKDLDKGFAIMNAETFFKELINIKGVFICKKESSTVNELQGSLIVLQSDRVDVIGEGSNLFLSFKYNDEDYLLRLSKYN